MLRFLLGLILGVLLALAVPVVIVAGGFVDLAATSGPGATEEAVTGWTIDRWVTTHTPDDLANTAPPTTTSWERGLDVYEASCVGCHGAPDVDAAAWADHMVPEPSDLAHAGDELTESQLYHVIDHGIRLTGMPAYRELLDEDQVWQLIRFVRDIEHLTPDQKERLRATVEAMSPPRRDRMEPPEPAIVPDET